MTREANDQDDQILDELTSGRLRQAVEQVRNSPVPDPALRRALDRAQDLASVTLAIRNRPTEERRPWNRFAAVVGIVCLLLILGALARTVGNSVERAREAARRAQSVNNLKQLGIAMHNYHDTDRRLMLVDDSKSMFRAGLSNRLAILQSKRGSAKIIHTAEMVLVVDDISATESNLSKLVEKYLGRIGNSEIDEPKGRPRTALWVVRVPVDSLNSFLRDVVELGTPVNRSTNTNDVTEEYVDLETRINSKRQLEKRILGLLEEKTGDIKEVLSVEEQLARVREEIEQMELRVKKIDSATAMTTVSISAQEQRDYVPPQSPTFSKQIGRAWEGSIDLLGELGRSFVLVAVAIGPWLPIVVVLIVGILRYLKRRQSHRGA